MMNTPICDFVKKYAGRGALRLHMPGHKGVSTLGVEQLDITEIDGADVLYNSSGIIRESEENAAALFGAARTVYSTEGSSLSIRAMLYLAVLHARSCGRRPIIVAARNAHKTFMTAAALLGIEVVWLSPTVGSAMVCTVTEEHLDNALSLMKELPAAVYITSPNYLGIGSDISGISRACKRHGVPLLVDNAHGAYLNFLPQKAMHPIALGADMCADSAHKTLPVLTGGAYLHISKNAPPIFSELCEQAMGLFASTSPSYLILQSLDAANRYIHDGYRERLADFVNEVAQLKSELAECGYRMIGEEPLKLTVLPKSYGYTGFELAESLLEHDIVCEFASADTCTLMFTPEIGKKGVLRVGRAFADIPKMAEIDIQPPPLHIPERAMSIREAMLSPSEVLPIHHALGRVLADADVACPPAVPIVISGEIIDEAAIEAFRYYGTTSVRVVKNK